MRIWRVEAGAVDPLVFAEVPLADVPGALTALGRRETHGKLVVTP